MYDILAYGNMVADHVRVDAYARALQLVIKPGDVVADIGAGTGILSLLACRAGAKRVFAIEPNDAIAVAREIAAANGFSDRITFIQDVSTQVTLPQTTDVIVSDLRGILPVFQDHLATIIDARQRFLSPGGHLVPLRDTLMAAVVSAPELHTRHVGQANVNGLDMRAACALCANTCGKARFTPEQMLSIPHRWATLEYPTIDDCAIHADLNLPCVRQGVAHGFSTWFDAELANGVVLSNAPGTSAPDYGNTYFPWPEPVDLCEGDVVHLVIRATPMRGDYVWRWDTRILDAGRRDGLRRQFSQSTFKGAALSGDQLRKFAEDYVPELTEDGNIAGIALDLMRNGRSLGEIARQIASEFPERFPDWKAALDYIGDLSHRYS